MSISIIFTEINSFQYANERKKNQAANVCTLKTQIIRKSKIQGLSQINNRNINCYVQEPLAKKTLEPTITS